MKDLILSLHIPKTGGVTFYNSAKQLFQSEEIYLIHSSTYHGYLTSRQRLECSSIHFKQKIAFVHGHFSFGLHRSFVERKFCYVTYLRHPFDRLISLYFYIKDQPTHPLYRPIHENEWSLADFVSSNVHPEIENCQTKMLSGRPETDFLTGKQQCSEIDLNRAISNVINYFPVVGLTEELEKSLELISFTFNLDITCVGHQNETSYRTSIADLSELTFKVLEAKNLYDMELYNFCKNRYQKQLKSQRTKIFFSKLKKRIS